MTTVNITIAKLPANARIGKLLSALMAEAERLGLRVTFDGEGQNRYWMCEPRYVPESKVVPIRRSTVIQPMPMPPSAA